MTNKTLSLPAGRLRRPLTTTIRCRINAALQHCSLTAPCRLKAAFQTRPERRLQPAAAPLADRRIYAAGTRGYDAANGVRPGTGAAISFRASALEYLDASGLLDVAAPGDGRTPARSERRLQAAAGPLVAALILFFAIPAPAMQTQTSISLLKCTASLCDASSTAW